MQINEKGSNSVGYAERIENFIRLAERFVLHLQKFDALEDKRGKGLTSIESGMVEKVRTEIQKDLKEIKSLNLDNRLMSTVFMTAVDRARVSAKTQGLSEKGVEVPTIGRTIAVANQVLNADAVLRYDDDLKNLSLGIVETSHIANILLKQTRLEYQKLAFLEASARLETQISQLKGSYVNDELIKASIYRATEYFNEELLEENGLPVDPEAVAQEVFGEGEILQIEF